MSIAAKDRGERLTWRTAPDRQLRFVLATLGEPVPGGRKRATPTTKNGRRRKAS